MRGLAPSPDPFPSGRIIPSSHSTPRPHHAPSSLPDPSLRPQNSSQINATVSVCHLFIYFILFIYFMTSLVGSAVCRRVTPCPYYGRWVRHCPPTRSSSAPTRWPCVRRSQDLVRGQSTAAMSTRSIAVWTGRVTTSPIPYEAAVSRLSLDICLLTTPTVRTGLPICTL